MKQKIPEQIIVTCDICKNVIKKTANVYPHECTVKLEALHEWTSESRTLDMCPKCFQKIQDFINKTALADD